MPLIAVSVASTLNAGAWREVADFALATGGPDDRVKTDGLVVLHRGQIVAEAYAHGYAEATPHLAWSTSKSFTGALIGIAAREGLVSLTDPAAKHYPPLAAAGHKDLTIEQILRMSSGLAWRETYEMLPIYSSVLKMLYLHGRKDMAAFAASHEAAFPPGKRWRYSSGDTNILQGLLATALKDRYERFPWTELFEPLGMTSVTWERDGAGHYVGSSYLYATPRDMARFGQLFLQDGMWGDRRILPEGFVKHAFTLAPAMLDETTPVADLAQQYGAQWWLNTGVEARGVKPRWPDAPKDTACAEGHWGQYVWVIPSLELVIVRTGDDRLAAFDANGLLARAVKAVTAEARP